MNHNLDLACERMCRYLNQNGIRAFTAWPDSPRNDPAAPDLVVSLRACQVKPAGFQDYLGERFNASSGLWEDVFGRQAYITFGLDLFAHANDEPKIQHTFDALSRALAADGPPHLQVLEISCGETAFDPNHRLLKRPVQALCSTYLVRSVNPDGSFTDFELLGELSL